MGKSEKSIFEKLTKLYLKPEYCPHFKDLVYSCEDCESFDKKNGMCELHLKRSRESNKSKAAGHR